MEWILIKFVSYMIYDFYHPLVLFTSKDGCTWYKHAYSVKQNGTVKKNKK